MGKACHPAASRLELIERAGHEAAADTPQPGRIDIRRQYDLANESCARVSHVSQVPVIERQPHALRQKLTMKRVGEKTPG